MKLLVLSLFLSLGLYSQAETTSAGLIEDSDPLEHLALDCIGRGDAFLVFHQYTEALAEFNRVMPLLEDLGDKSDVIGFLASFGKIIAYDNLGMVKECKEAMGDLLFIVIDEDNVDEIDDESISEDLRSSKSNSDSLVFLRNLASLAQTKTVRALLDRLIDQMIDEISPPVSIVPQGGGSPFEWKYAQACDNYYTIFKVTFWKKIKRLGKLATKIVDCIEGGLQYVVDGINYIDSLIER